MELHKPYFSPMDEGIYTAKDTGAQVQLEKPIFSAKEIGSTVPESMGGQGNFIQNIESYIRLGTGTIQLVLTTPHTQQLMGRMKAYGKEARETMRELTKAAGIQVAGIEMPTSSITNLSGFDQRSGRVSDEMRRSAMDEVREGLKFIAEVGGGGGVDIWSQEFARSISEVNEYGKAELKFAPHGDEKQELVGLVVDKETGQLVADLTKAKDFPRIKYARNEQGYFVDAEGKAITNPDDFEKRVPILNKEGTQYETEVLTWQRIKEDTERYRQLTHNEELRPEIFFIKDRLASEVAQQRSSRLQLEENYEHIQSRAEAMKKQLEAVRTSGNAELIEDMERQVRMSDDRVNSYRETIAIQRRAEEMQKEKKKNYVSLHDYAKERSVDAYAELGIEAMKTQKQMANKITQDLYVGPELGWPTAWGGHPREFIELVKTARKEMEDRLVKENYSTQEAKKLAEKHIKGVFDTSHLAMWYDYMDKDPKMTEEQNLKKFNEWFMKEVEQMRKEGVIGSVQAVDSMSGAHSHLPPGQGVFPVVEAVVHLKKQGWDGPVVSEGHEEESLGKGRILLQAWKAFGADLGPTYFTPTGARRMTQWTDVEGSYFGRHVPPNYIFGSYAPSREEWTFWSGIPLE